MLLTHRARERLWFLEKVEHSTRMSGGGFSRWAWCLSLTMLAAPRAEPDLCSLTRSGHIAPRSSLTFISRILSTGSEFEFYCSSWKTTRGPFYTSTGIFLDGYPWHPSLSNLHIPYYLKLHVHFLFSYN